MTGMEDIQKIQITIEPDEKVTANNEYDLDRIIFDLDNKIELLSNKADNFDYLISIASGVLCAALDIFWVGDFSLQRGRDFASEEIDNLVKKTAKMFGCKDDDLKSCIRFLEKKFPIPSDGNAPDFGSGHQHHLRDFAHHPTLIGLIFSILTQFTYKSYGTDVNGNFIVVAVPEASKIFIGDDVTTKILYGTIAWFFHLVSDAAGSSSSVVNGGGTGIPGPILSLAKEMSALPFFQNMKIGDNSLSVFLSKLFNGTLLAKRDESGKIIKESILKFDLRGELGVGAEIGRQAIPVIANECIVRVFYFIRHLSMEIIKNNVQSFNDMERIDWDKVKPVSNPTITRMLTIATGVFTTVDVSEAIIAQKYWIAVNYVGVGRFALAVGQDVAWCLKARNINEIKHMYEKIKRFTYTQEDERIYERMESDINDTIDKFGLNIIQTEILYNLEYYKTFNDIWSTKLPVDNDRVKQLKQEWLDEWQAYMTQGFASFIQVEGAQLHWYSEEELIEKIEQNNPSGTWFRLVLLEAMLFEPYYPLSIEKNKKGNDVPSKKYKEIQNHVKGYRKGIGDSYLEDFFNGEYYTKGYIERLRKCYGKVLRELNEVLKTVIKSLSITALIAVAAVVTAGAFAPAIAVALVGSNFAGLSGAALTSACLAYLGGGAIAVGGAGMAGGTIAIVGGGAVLGLGVGAGVGGTVGAIGLLGKENTVLQSAKLLVAVREIFLNDEHDLVYSSSVYEKYAHGVAEIEKGITEMKFQAELANDKDKNDLKDRIKEAEKSVEAMKIAGRSMAKFISSFECGLNQ